MNIDISVKEYFEQLQLMEIQYGQEEELYPWIYMLLWMVEHEKQRLLSDYQGISIRDVHNVKSGTDSINKIYKKAIAIKNYIKERGIPEFILFDKNSNNDDGCQCFGCVEIKALNKHYIKLNDKTIFNIEKPTTFYYELKFKGIDKKSHCYKIDESTYNKLDACVEKFKISNNGKVIYLPKTETESYNEIDISSLKEKQWKGRGLTTSEVKVDKIREWATTIEPFDDKRTAEQMLEHIESYKKVLYTNGLQFCFITLLEKQNEQNKFKVIEIANLQKHYERYKNSESTQEDENAAIIEWEKLKIGLMSIDWYQNPIPDPISVLESKKNKTPVQIK